jgi:hypothetical protein
MNDPNQVNETALEMEGVTTTMESTINIVSLMSTTPMRQHQKTWPTPKTSS